MDAASDATSEAPLVSRTADEAGDAGSADASSKGKLSQLLHADTRSWPHAPTRLAPLLGVFAAVSLLVVFGAVSLRRHTQPQKHALLHSTGQDVARPEELFSRKRLRQNTTETKRPELPCNPRVPLGPPPSAIGRPRSWPLDDHTQATCKSAIDKLSKQHFTHTNVAAKGRQWCWMGLKEFGCHRVVNQRYTWKKAQTFAAAMNVTVPLQVASFEPLLQREICEEQEFGRSRQWSPPEWDAAVDWFRENVEVYVVNMDAFKDRWRTMIARLDKLKITPIRVQGVDLRFFESRGTRGPHQSHAMGRSMARILPLVSLRLLPAAAQTTTATPCFTEGMAYTGHQVISPGYVHSAEVCQSQCSLEAYCAFFTWRAAPNSTLGYGPGSCTKFNDQATLIPVGGEPAETVSGPVKCPGSEPLTTGTTSAPIIPVTLEPSVPPLPTLPPAPGILPTPEVPDMGMNMTNFTNGTVPIVPGAGATGGFPWWAIVLIVAVLLAVGAAVLFGMCDGSKKKKKSSKAKKTKKSSKEERLNPAEGQALMRTEAPPPMVEPAVPTPAQEAVASASAAAASTAMPMATQVAAPVTTSMPVAAPVTTYTAAQPAFGSGSPVYTSGGQVVYMQQPAVQMVYR